MRKISRRSTMFALASSFLVLAAMAGAGCDECESSCDCLGKDLGPHPDCAGEPVCTDGACAWACRSGQGPEACLGDQVWDEVLGICTELTRCAQ